MTRTLARISITYEELPDSGQRVPKYGDYFMWKNNSIMHYCVDEEHDAVGWSPACEYRLFKVVAKDEQPFSVTVLLPWQRP